jgi:hypothetical protein
VDWLGAEELARVIAPYLRRAGWRPVLVPSMPYGASPLAEDWTARSRSRSRRYGGWWGKSLAVSPATVRAVAPGSFAAPSSGSYRPSG